MTERFSASVASRLEICPGSGNLDLAIPGFEVAPRDQMAGAAGRGTWMHDILAWVCDQELSDRETFVAILRDFADLGYRKRDLYVTDSDKGWAWLDDNNPHVEPIDAEFLGLLNHTSVVTRDGTVTLDRLAPRELRFMAEAIEFFESIVAKTGTDNLHLEEKVTIGWLQSKPNTTADVVVWDEEELDIIDWKTGAIPVDAVNNVQLEFYAGAWFHLQPHTVRRIRVHIVQPGNISSWEFTRDDLHARIEQLREAEAKVLDKDLTLVPSDHCKFCPANPHSRGDKGTPSCPAMLDLLYPKVLDTDEILGMV